MTSAWVIGVAGIIVGLIIWGAIRNARNQGAADQRAKDIQAAKDAEAKIHAVQTEERDTEETKDRLNKGTF